jgi:hypothetical protein
MSEQSELRRLPHRQRGRIMRSGLFYTALTSLCAAFGTVAMYKIVTGDSGFMIMFFIALIFGLILGYWALQYLRDMGAELERHEGEVMKKWYKSHPLEIAVLLGFVFLLVGAFRILTGIELAFLPLIGIAIIAFLIGVRLILPLLGEISLALAERESPGLPVILASSAMGVFRPSFYLLIENKVYAVNRLEYSSVLEDDLVRVTCYPHSLVVEAVERYDTYDKTFVPAVSGTSG